MSYETAAKTLPRDPSVIILPESRGGGKNPPNDSFTLKDHGNF